MNEPLKVVVLGSGSSGNAALVEIGGCRFLLDCGLAPNELSRRLLTCGRTFSSLTGVLLSHEHGDHCVGLKAAGRAGTAVFGTEGTVRALGGKFRNDSINWRVFPSNSVFDINGVQVTAFRVSHDAAEPVGYMLRYGDDRVGYVPDCGLVTVEMVGLLAGCTVLLIESNHDRTMLNRSDRPAVLKQRIEGPTGHLSNEQAADLLSRVTWPGLKAACLIHLSGECNTEELARAVVGATIDSACKLYVGRAGDVVECAW